MCNKVQRPGVRAGYDVWSETYDRTANPLVALDRRHTVALLAPGRGERILDAGCGTGGNLGALLNAGSRAVGIDFSRGMLQVARRRLGAVALAQADLNDPLPVQPRAFDGVLCALVGEHLAAPARFFVQAWEALAPGGRLVFSVFHPAMAAAGLEANFQQTGVEYRLGAHRHTVDDYLQSVAEAGFSRATARAHEGDEALAGGIPAARKYVGQPLLLTIEAHRS